MKLFLCIVGYFVLFIIFEYINAKNMTSMSWLELVKYNFRPHIFIFFALSPILVWGFNKELYEFVNNNFWFTGILLNLIEFFSYLLGSYIFYKTMPSFNESVAFVLMLIAIVIAGMKNIGG